MESKGLLRFQVLFRIITDSKIAINALQDDVSILGAHGVLEMVFGSVIPHGRP